MMMRLHWDEEDDGHDIGDDEEWKYFITSEPQYMRSYFIHQPNTGIRKYN